MPDVDNAVRQLIASRGDWFGVGPGALPLWGRADRRQFIDTADVGSTPRHVIKTSNGEVRTASVSLTLAVRVLGRTIATNRSRLAGSL